MKRISRDELKNLLLSKHLRRLPPLAACARFNGFQAQFALYPEQAFFLRSLPELYAEGSWRRDLVRAWTVRGTLHVFPQSDLPLYLYEARPDLIRAVDNMGDDPYMEAGRKRFFAETILAALQTGDKTRDELKSACRAEGLTEQEERSVFDPWGGLVRCLADQGKMVQRYGGSAPYRLVSDFVPMEKEQAEREIVRRYIDAYGPVSMADCRYYFKRPKRDIEQWLSELPVQTLMSGGEERYFLPDGDPLPAPPACALLAGFDPLLLGYEKTKSPFLANSHIRDVYTLTGIVKPAILYEGAVIGTWKNEKNRPALRFFDDVPQRAIRRAERICEKTWVKGKE